MAFSREKQENKGWQQSANPDSSDGNESESGALTSSHETHTVHKEPTIRFSALYPLVLHLLLFLVYGSIAYLWSCGLRNHHPQYLDGESLEIRKTWQDHSHTAGNRSTL